MYVHMSVPIIMYIRINNDSMQLIIIKDSFANILALLKITLQYNLSEKCA